MHFGYSCARQLIVVSLLAGPLTVRTERKLPTGPAVPVMLPQAVDPDPRVVRLHEFLLGLHCPVSSLAEDFIAAADNNQLDWRLLPSIAVIESGGGKAYKNNNIFGWDNGEQAFPTIRYSIHELAFRLTNSPIYRNRDVKAKLRLYNPNQGYAEAVLAVMHRISPALDPEVRRARSS